MGFTKDKEPITAADSVPLYYNPMDPEEIELEPNEEKKIGLAVGVPPDAENGIYLFNIKTEYLDGATPKKFSSHQIKTEVI